MTVSDDRVSLGDNTAAAVAVERAPIAIVGLSALFPGSIESTGFWRDILAGTDLITDVPPTHWLTEDYYDPDPTKPDKTYAKRGAFLRDVDFDALGWGVPPSILSATDTSQLLALIVAQRVLDEASKAHKEVNRDRTSVILGVTSAQGLLGAMVSRLQRPIWVKSLREAGLPEDEVEAICARITAHYAPWQEATFPGLLGNVVAGRIANRLDLGGTNCVTDAACASTFSALAMGVSELHLGSSDLVITGGVDTMNDIFMYMCFSKTPALSPTGDCRPFSDAGDGTMLGEGIGMFALKRLADAERDGNRIYGLLRGVGTSSDGRSKSVYAPVATGQAKALRRAYAQAGYSAATVELVEAHGTGTKAGDAAEFEGLRLAFDESGRTDRQWCALGSVKSQIGHAKAAAGAAGLFKAVMSLHQGVLPATIKIDRPNSKLHLERSPFYLSTRLRPWVRAGDHPRRAGVSSFGFGGSNFHLAVEEYRGAHKAPQLRSSPMELLPLSAGSAAELAASVRALLAAPRLPGSLAWLAHSRRHAYTSRPARLALVASSEAELQAKLERALAWLEAGAGAELSSPDGLFISLEAVGEGQTAFLFPGQGSQYLDMGAGLAIRWPEALAAWDHAAALPTALPLQEAVFPRPTFDAEAQASQEARLTATDVAQPAIGAASLALLDVLGRIGLSPDATAGHSFGEVMALHAAGALSRDEVLGVALARGQRMAEAAASTEGAMTAVTCGAAELRLRLVGWGIDDVVLANDNSPDQVVLSGPRAAIEAVEARLSAEGLRFNRLRVATAFHSPVVAASAEPFRAALDAVAVYAPRIPAWSNETAQPYPEDPEALRDQLGRQLAQPVRWVELVLGLWNAGVRRFVEVGPGSVLTGMVSRILEGRPHVAVELDRKGRDGHPALLLGLARLLVAGQAFDVARLDSHLEAPDDPAARAKPKLAIPINGSNYGQPYPPPNGAAGLPKPNPPRATVAPATAPVAATPASAPAAQKTPPPTAPPPTAPPPTAPPPNVLEETPVTAPLRPAPSALAPAPALNPASPTPSAGLVTYAAAPSAPGPAWLGAWQEAQRQTAEAHAAWQNAMTAGHDRFLRTVETGFLGLTSALTGQPLSAAPAAAWTPAPPRQLAAPAPVYAAPAPVYAAPAPVYAAPAPVYAAPAPVYAAPAPVAPAPVAPAPVAAAPAVKPAPAPAVKPAPVAAAPVAAKAPVADLGATLLAVVADKTGYPADLLHLEMELEGDLGVDSIKRVEILGAMQEKVPGLPEVDPAAVASMKTLGQILSFLREKSGGAAPAPAAPAKPAPVPTAPAAANGVHAAAPAQAAPAGKGGNIDLPALLLAIVADKTGYPADLLHLDMELEGDLGIDSIKRVEILSAVQERAPGLPEVEAAEMASLRTLGQIQEHLMSKLGGAAASPSTAGSLVNPSERTGRAIGRFTLELVKIPAAGLVLAGLGAGTVRVIPDDLGVADALVGLLRERGYDAAVGEPTAETRSLLVLTGLSALPDRAAATALDRRAFEAARAFARLPGGGVFLTVQDTGGSFGAEPVLAPEGAVSRAWLSGLSALARTGAQEWPDRAVKALDVEVGGRPAPVVARVILDELLAGGPEREVALRADGLRRVPRSVSTPAAPRAGRPLPERAVVVVTGGARGVTAACCLSLAEAQPCRFALLGRTPLLPEPAEARGAADEGALKKALVAAAISRGERPAPAQISKQVSQILASREVEATLLGLQARGSEARYLAADAADAASLGEALAAVRAAWGPIQALVHGAGVIADKAIAEKSDEAFARVYDTKVAGLQALLDRTAGDPLAAILLFSSVAARAGNAGQCDYAMANEVLNKVAWAEAARRPGCVVRALGWGPWEGGMVTPALKALFAARGVPMIPILDGAHAFVDELLDPSREGEVVLGGEPKAEALAGQRAPAEARYEIVVDGRFTVLDDHSIQGVPVVPVVFALEWFTRAVQAFRPGLFLQELRDVKVLRGIPLPSYAERPGRLLLTVKALAEDELLVELRDATGGLRYTARARTGPAAPRPGPRAAEPRLEGWADRPVYDGHALFHGPRFQVITAMEGVSAEGLAARLTDMSALGWPSLAWTTDPAVNDGALQLAVLWSKHMLGGAALPTAIGSVRSYRPEPLAGPLRAVLVGRSSRGERTVSDLWMLDEQGVVVLAFEGVETHRRPGEPAQA